METFEVKNNVISLRPLTQNLTHRRRTWPHSVTDRHSQHTQPHTITQHTQPHTQHTAHSATHSTQHTQPHTAHSTHSHTQSQTPDAAAGTSLFSDSDTVTVTSCWCCGDGGGDWCCGDGGGDKWCWEAVVCGGLWWNKKLVRVVSVTRTSYWIPWGWWWELRDRRMWRRSLLMRVGICLCCNLQV